MHFEDTILDEDESNICTKQLWLGWFDNKWNLNFLELHVYAGKANKRSLYNQSTIQYVYRKFELKHVHQQDKMDW